MDHDLKNEAKDLLQTLDNTLKENGMVRCEGALSLTAPAVKQKIKRSQYAWEKALSLEILTDPEQLCNDSALPPQVEHCVSVPDASGRVGHVLPNPPRLTYTDLVAGGVTLPACLPRASGHEVTLPQHDAYQFDPTQDVIIFLSPSDPENNLR